MQSRWQAARTWVRSAARGCLPGRRSNLARNGVHPNFMVERRPRIQWFARFDEPDVPDVSEQTRQRCDERPAGSHASGYKPSPSGPPSWATATTPEVRQRSATWALPSSPWPIQSSAEKCGADRAMSDRHQRRREDAPRRGVSAHCAPHRGRGGRDNRLIGRRSSLQRADRSSTSSCGRTAAPPMSICPPMTSIGRRLWVRSEISPGEVSTEQ